MTTLNAKAEINKAAIIAETAKYAQTKEQALQNIESAENETERATFAATAKKMSTHEKYSEALSNMSEKALAALTTYKVDASELATQSRELKKRSIAILEALATKQRVKDTALDAVLQYIVAKDAVSMTLDQVAHQMQHKTTTQAQYFKTCAIFFNFATYSKSEKTIIFNKDSKMFKDLTSLYVIA